MSIVTKDIPAFSIAVGSPAKVIKTYNKDSNKWDLINKN
jgi:acetyltransferase-like isoleucine patch superfamily enzyme